MVWLIIHVKEGDYVFICRPELLNNLSNKSEGIRKLMASHLMCFFQHFAEDQLEKLMKAKHLSNIVSFNYCETYCINVVNQKSSCFNYGFHKTETIDDFARCPLIPPSQLSHLRRNYCCLNQVYLPYQVLRH